MDFKEISIRGRMAYLIRIFENLLIFYNCCKEDWYGIVEKLWQYMNIEYLDDWMYEFSEYLPECILEDDIDAFEYLEEKEIKRLKLLYKSNPDEINQMLNIIFELGTMEIYGKLVNNSPNTLIKLQEGINIALNKKIELPDKSEFEKYRYSERDGWGDRFDGRELSVFL